MSKASRNLEPRGRLLLGPGPSNVHPRVLAALGRPLVGHLDPQFLGLMDEVQEMLRSVFVTRNPVTLAISGTGSAGMEASLVNLIEPGDEVLVCVNGVFGQRMTDIVERSGGVLHRLDRPWGEIFTTEEILAVLDRNSNIRMLAIVHAETSTGAHQPLESLGKLCRNREILFVVDAVTSLAGTPVRVDEWCIDACYSGTQKCLSCPPGLSPLTLSAKAMTKLTNRRHKVMSWYLDLTLIQNYWAENRRAYHHTAPISMNYALHEALALVLEEGLAERHRRHLKHSRALMAALAALGLEAFAVDHHQLPMLNAVVLPDKWPDAAIRNRLLELYDIEIGGGLGDLAGKIWRIGLMGESARRKNVLALIGALEEILHDLRLRPHPGEAIAAASAVYAS